MRTARYGRGGQPLGAALIAAAAVLLQGLNPAAAETLRSVGSDTMRPLMEAWAAAFAETEAGANVTVSVQSPGSNAAPAEIRTGSSQLAPMSRKMRDAEIDAFREARGVRPVKVVVALDALAVYVREDNPIRGVTLFQLDRVFSKERACAGGGPIETWGPLLFGPLSEEAIELHSRDASSGTYSAFRELALCGGPLADRVIYHGDSVDLVAAVADAPAAIGFAGIGYDRDGVKPLAIAESSDHPYVPAIPERFRTSADLKARYKNVVSGKYPLSRDLQIYIDPSAADAETARAFLAFILSPEGQALVPAAGYIPLPETARASERRKLDPSYQPTWWRLEKPQWWPFG
ncbi:MAG: phosphate ABC transporter substrate-binding protein [Pseudomonadota bacterium]